MRTLNEDVKTSEGNTGDHTESLKQLDEAAIEDDTLVNSVEGRLANLRKLEGELDSAEAEDVSDASIPDVPDDELDDGQAVATDKSDDSTPDKEEADDKDADGKDGAVTIPDAFVRAAIHQGWEQGDVDSLIETNPELALKTLTSCYNSVTNATKEWSALGRAKVEQERAAAEANTKSVAEQVASDVDPLIERLKKDYGDDPLIETVTKLLQRDVKTASKPTTNAQQPSDLYKTATARANAAANASIDARVNTFFSSEAMTPYGDFYGKLNLSQTVSDLTNGQQEHRLNVLQEAEYIMTGLRMQGIDAPVEQVLEKAHLIVTEPVREQIIRNNLKKSATDRKKGMTFRPAKSKKAGTATTSNQQKPKNRQELLSKVSQNMAKVFNK